MDVRFTWWTLANIYLGLENIDLYVYSKPQRVELLQSDSAEMGL